MCNGVCWPHVSFPFLYSIGIYMKAALPWVFSCVYTPRLRWATFLLTFGFVHLKCLKHQQRRSDLRHWLEARQRKAVNGVTCNLWCNSTKNNYIWRNHSTESVQGFSYSFCWNYFLLQKWSQWKLSTVRTLGLSWVTWIFFMDRHVALRVGFFNVIFQSFWQHRLNTIYIL